MNADIHRSPGIWDFKNESQEGNDKPRTLGVTAMPHLHILARIPLHLSYVDNTPLFINHYLSCAVSGALRRDTPQ